MKLPNKFLFLFYFSTSLLAANEKESTPYPEFCETAAKSEVLFQSFKKNPYFQLFYERMTHQMGLDLLNFIKREYPALLQSAEKIRDNDRLGSPVSYDYGAVGRFSPTTLYYTKIAGDLQKRFGDLSQMNILEIGGCYGGQCKVLHDLFGFKSYTLVDKPYHLKLAKSYLEKLDVKNVHFIDAEKFDPTIEELLHEWGGDSSTDKQRPRRADLNYLPDLDPPLKRAGLRPGAVHYDLVISNGALSDTDKNELLSLLQSQLLNAPRGYLVINLPERPKDPSQTCLSEMLLFLLETERTGKIDNEIPLTAADNRVITWKSSSLFAIRAPQFFKKDPAKKCHLPLDGTHALTQLLYKKPVTIPAPLLTYNPPFEPMNAVTYARSGGRLGDNLTAYFHARWISYKLGIPLQVIPFEYYDQFALSDMDTMINTRPFLKEIETADENQIRPGPNSTLYILPYFTESPFEFGEETKLPFYVDWQDPLFIKEVKTALQPKNPVPLISLPKDRLTIGLHVRRGGGFDSTNFYSMLPLKFPPDSYYIEQLRLAVDLFKDENPIIYLLTDDLHPEEIAESYRKALNNPHLEIVYRKECNNPWNNVLTDFYTIAHFDCFIGSQSHFAVVAAKLGDYILSIYPTHPVMRDGNWVVDRVEIHFNGKNSHKLHATLPPPAKIPSDLKATFTMNGKVDLQTWYFDQRVQKNAPLQIKQADLTEMTGQVRERKSFFYGLTDVWLYEALDKYRDSLKEKEIAVFGPTSPIYEAVALAYEGHPTRIDLVKSESEDPRVKTMSLESADHCDNSFDAIFSIVSFNHDGLGRYGDPIDPNGDLAAMQRAKKMLKKDGLLFLSVPVGKDCLVWNAHRIYGLNRLPLLLEGWELVESFGLKDSDLNVSNPSVPHQPIFVLRPMP